MAYVQPFKGTYFTLNNGELSDLIIPPYDAIPKDDEAKYKQRSPYNFSHVDLSTKENDDYAHSAETLKSWSEKGILAETTEPCYFLYQQKFSAYGATHTRSVILCTVGLADFSKAIVRPHENTFGKYKTDRLQLMKRTGYNLSHIFGMVRDEKGYLNTLFETWAMEKPFLSGKSDDGVTHTIWKVPASKAPGVTGFFQDLPVYIVDGHHRYESSLMNAREMGVEGKYDHPAASTTFCIANAYDPGLVVFPTHRILRAGSPLDLTVERIEKEYELTPLSKEALSSFVTKADPAPKFAIYFKGSLYFCTPRNWTSLESSHGKSIAKLAVTWSDHKFLKELCGVTDQNRGERIRYEKDLEVTWAQAMKSDLTVFHAPPAVTDVLNVADEKRFMPQKSTFFIPKLYGGLVMRKFT